MELIPYLTVCAMSLYIDEHPPHHYEKTTHLWIYALNLYLNIPLAIYGLFVEMYYYMMGWHHNRHIWFPDLFLQRSLPVPNMYGTVWT